MLPAPPVHRGSPSVPVANGCASGKAWRIRSLGPAAFWSAKGWPGTPLSTTVRVSVSGPRRECQPHPVPPPREAPCTRASPVTLNLCASKHNSFKVLSHTPQSAQKRSKGPLRWRGRMEPWGPLGGTRAQVSILL